LNLRRLFAKFGEEPFLVQESAFTFAKFDNDVGSTGHLISSHGRADSRQLYGNAEFGEFKSNRHSRSGFPVCQGSIVFSESEKRSS
jgi:hypothetical protein